MGIISVLGNLFGGSETAKQNAKDYLYKLKGIEFNKQLQWFYRINEYRYWYEGDPDILYYFYSSFHKPLEFVTTKNRWYEWSYDNNKIPKLSFGTARFVSKQLEKLVFSGDINISVQDADAIQNDKDHDAKLMEYYNDRLKVINEHIGLQEILQKAFLDETWGGTVLFTVVIDREVSDLPILQYYTVDYIDFEQKYGVVVKIETTNKFKENNIEYVLKTIYSKKGIEYKLYNGGKEVSLASTNYTKDLQVIKFGSGVQLFNVCVLKKNNIVSSEFRDTNFGASEYESLIDTFHLIDEVYSSLNAYIRGARPSLAISDELTQAQQYLGENGEVYNSPRVPKQHALDVIPLASGILATGQNAQPIYKRDIPQLMAEPYHDALIKLVKNVFITIGISPKTLNLVETKSGEGSNAKAIYASEKVTYNTRNEKVTSWITCITRVCQMLLMYDDIIQGRFEYVNGEYIPLYDFSKLPIKVIFPELNSNDFESRLDSAIIAYTNGLMSQDFAIEYALKYKFSTNDIKLNLDQIKEELKAKLEAQNSVGNSSVNYDGVKEVKEAPTVDKINED